jgi:hypothetical protein
MIIVLYIAGCKSIGNPVVSTASSSNPIDKETYQIPSDQQKESYSVEDFKHLYSEYLKLNNTELETSPESDKTEMSGEDKLKYYTIYEITPEDVKEEIGCQIFKVNYTCETYVIHKSKLFAIGFGFGGNGITDIKTCNFDGDGQKDLIYTFSWGSGIHRSHIGVFNFSKEQEEWLDFQQVDKDIILEKNSDNNFDIYTAKISQANLDFVHLKLSREEHIADVKTIRGKIGVIKYNQEI